jgi:hypothetical protein
MVIVVINLSTGIYSYWMKLFLFSDLLRLFPNPVRACVIYGINQINQSINFSTEIIIVLGICIIIMFICI